MKNISKTIERNKKAIIIIDLQKPGQGNQKQISVRGTGFIISEDGKFITNLHIYKQIPQSELEYLGASVPGKTDPIKGTQYDRYSVKLLKPDEQNDLALMKIESDKKFDTIQKIGDAEKVKEGEEVVYTGYPLATEMLSMGFGITMTSNKCIISSVKRRGIDGSLHFFLIDTHANNGSSGSPVFSIDNGKVIGVISGRINSVTIPTSDGKGRIDIPANIAICVPGKYIENLLK